MFIATLIVLNIPVYLFLAWVIFDDVELAADSLFENLVALLKRALIPPFIRVLFEVDDEADGAWHSIAFLIACVGVTWFEYWLLQEFWFNEGALQTVGMIGPSQTPVD